MNLLDLKMIDYITDEKNVRKRCTKPKNVYINFAMVILINLICC